MHRPLEKKSQNKHREARHTTDTQVALQDENDRFWGIIREKHPVLDDSVGLCPNVYGEWAKMDLRL
jgi:hypothetical protein